MHPPAQRVNTETISRLKGGCHVLGTIRRILTSGPNWEVVSIIFCATGNVYVPSFRMLKFRIPEIRPTIDIEIISSSLHSASHCCPREQDCIGNRFSGDIDLTCRQNEEFRASGLSQIQDPRSNVLFLDPCKEPDPGGDSWTSFPCGSECDELFIRHPGIMLAWHVRAW